MKKEVTWTADEWADWRWQQRHRIRTLAQLEQWIEPSPAERRAFEQTQAVFRTAITPYYASLINPDDPSCPIRLQAVPQLEELQKAPSDLSDPLGEERFMVAPGLTHRYPDRALLYTNHNCPVYCRFCTRKRKVSDPRSMPSKSDYRQAFDYLRAHPEIRDVVISGGDPLSLSTDRLVIFMSQQHPPHQILPARFTQPRDAPAALRRRPRRAAAHLPNSPSEYLLQHPLQLYRRGHRGGVGCM